MVNKSMIAKMPSKTEKTIRIIYKKKVIMNEIRVLHQRGQKGTFRIRKDYVLTTTCVSSRLCNNVMHPWVKI